MKTKKTKKFKKVSENLSKEERNYVEVLLENVDSKFDIVVEGQRVLDKKIDNLDDKMDEKFKEVDYKFEVVFGELGKINLRLDNIEIEIRSVKNEIKELRTLLIQKADLGRLEALEKRVIAMEKFIKNQFAAQL